jgi:hypothetical protein
MVDGGRAANKVLEASADLESPGKVKIVPHGVCHSVRTTCIFMIS